MKGLLLVFVTLAFVPFAISVRDFPFSPSVVDTNGKEVIIGVPYYAVSAALFQPAGLCLVRLSNKTLECAHDVVQCTSNPILGLPIVFGVNGTVEAVVKESTAYNIRFPISAAGLLCLRDTFWGLADVNIFSKYITTNPAAPTAAAKFQMQRDGFGYKISYCVSIPVPRTPICYALGFIQDGANSRLGIGIGVQPVQFFFNANVTIPPHQNHASS